MSYTFHSAAEAEFLECISYYESKVPGLGKTLIDEFEHLLQLVLQSPEAWQTELPPDIRRIPMKRFPLSVIYRIKHEQIQILALAHDKRRPWYWINR
ncbi:type II toxin-antitoxin system RelE/ParE family toxin [Oceanospirillum sanctuarii]|uniref:type II toxin-antitoxin system RelE/ParE family toxin n=1 Tax=Oceanospirillum sanctuarii TaxID=1434821 RepID=UPI000A36DE05|nr:type II toxin-antitoxin system RelE/ParE family toxin [Oceanospirillum sanctuarii]